MIHPRSHLLTVTPPQRPKAAQGWPTQERACPALEERAKAQAEADRGWGQACTTRPTERTPI
jgi:hypothetical protein